MKTPKPHTVISQLPGGKTDTILAKRYTGQPGSPSAARVARMWSVFYGGSSGAEQVRQQTKAIEGSARPGSNVTYWLGSVEGFVTQDVAALRVQRERQVGPGLFGFLRPVETVRLYKVHDRSEHAPEVVRALAFAALGDNKPDDWAVIPDASGSRRATVAQFREQFTAEQPALLRAQALPAEQARADVNS